MLGGWSAWEAYRSTCSIQLFVYLQQINAALSWGLPCLASGLLRELTHNTLTHINTWHSHLCWSFHFKGRNLIVLQVNLRLDSCFLYETSKNLKAEISSQQKCSDLLLWFSRLWSDTFCLIKLLLRCALNLTGTYWAVVAEGVEWSSSNLKVGSSIPSLPKKSACRSVLELCLIEQQQRHCMNVCVTGWM